jgi:hypothetical protein
MSAPPEPLAEHAPAVVQAHVPYGDVQWISSMMHLHPQQRTQLQCMGQHVPGLVGLMRGGPVAMQRAFSFVPTSTPSQSPSAAPARAPASSNARPILLSSSPSSSSSSSSGEGKYSRGDRRRHHRRKKEKKKNNNKEEDKRSGSTGSSSSSGWEAVERVDAGRRALDEADAYAKGYSEGYVRGVSYNNGSSRVRVPRGNDYDYDYNYVRVSPERLAQFRFPSSPPLPPSSSSSPSSPHAPVFHRRSDLPPSIPAHTEQENQQPRFQAPQTEYFPVSSSPSPSRARSSGGSTQRRDFGFPLSPGAYVCICE